MKKFIALTIGLSLLGATLIVPMSNASREAYHNYISQKVKESGRYRHSTYHQGNQKQILFPRKIATRKGDQKRFRRNYLIPRVGKRNLHRTNLSNRNLKFRSSTNRVLGTSMGYKKSHRMTISTKNNLDSNSFDFINYNNEIFSLEIPTNSIVNDKNGVLELRFPMSSMKFSAKKLDNKCGENLSLCARAVSRTIDRSNDIYRTSKTVQDYQKTDVVLGSVGLDSKKFVEGFIGIVKGKTSFLARFVVQGQNGDMFLVEASSNIKDIDKTVVFAKKVFETFRAKY